MILFIINFGFLKGKIVCLTSHMFVLFTALTAYKYQVYLFVH